MFINCLFCNSKHELKLITGAWTSDTKDTIIIALNERVYKSGRNLLQDTNKYIATLYLEIKKNDICKHMKNRILASGICYNCSISPDPKFKVLTIYTLKKF